MEKINSKLLGISIPRILVGHELAGHTSMRVVQQAGAQSDGNLCVGLRS